MTNTNEKKQENKSIVKLRNVRLSFPSLFETAKFDGQDTGKYEATFLILKDDPQVKDIEEAAYFAAVKKFGDKKAKTVLEQVKKIDDRYVLRDGDTQREEHAGYYTLKAKSVAKPRVMGHNPKIELNREEGHILYAGCYVNASVEIYAYDNMKTGISASLRGVQFYKYGDAFAGGTPARSEEFEDLSCEEPEAFDDLI